MKDQSSITSESVALQLTALVQGGPMTVATYMECLHLLGDLLRSSVRTTDGTTSQDGSPNSTSKLSIQVEVLEQSSIRSTEPPAQKTNTPLSHSGCWCNSSKKRDTTNA